MKKLPIEVPTRDALLLAKARDIIDWFLSLDNGPALHKYEKDHAALMERVSKFQDYFENEEPVDNWISVEDRLPEKKSHLFKDRSEGIIIGSTISNFVHPDAAYNFEKQIFEVCIDLKFFEKLYVTHWQPLPEPPTKNNNP